MRTKVMLILTLLFTLALTGAASASVTATVGSFNSEAAAIQALNNWRGASDFTLLETFEGFDPEVPVGALPGFIPTNGQSIYASFGDPQAQFYVDGGLSGVGQMRL
jgi:opacity protein-like surface antigen